jgi:hypothetical protein
MPTPLRSIAVDQEADGRIRRALVLLEFADAAQLKVTRS